MSGHGVLHSAPDGGVAETVKHDFRLLAAELISTFGAMYVYLKMGVPQWVTAGQQSDAMLAAKLSMMFSSAQEAKRWLARMGFMLPAGIYGGGGYGY